MFVIYCYDLQDMLTIIFRISSLTWSHFFYYEYQLTPHSSPSLDFGGRGCAPPSGLPSSMTMSLPPSLLLPVPPSSSRSCDSLAQVVDRITLTLNRGWSTDLQGFSHITPLFYIFCNLCPHCGLHDYLLEATFQKGILSKPKRWLWWWWKRWLCWSKENICLWRHCGSILPPPSNKSDAFRSRA